LAILPTLGLFIAILATVVAAPPSITVARVEEDRARQLEETSIAYPRADNLRLVLNLSGMGDRIPRRAGKWQVEEAVDDQGTDLSQERKAEKRDNAEFAWVQFDRKTDKNVSLTLELKASARRATSIARLRGSVSVMVGGEPRVASIANIKGKLGQSIDDPALTAAGIEVKLLPHAKDEGPVEFTVRFKGKVTALDESQLNGGADVVDADGKSVTSGYTETTRRDGFDRQFNLHRPLSDDMNLKIMLLVGLQTEEVKFNLKDVPLP
jgi:hypothetical protein